MAEINAELIGAIENKIAEELKIKNWDDTEYTIEELKSMVVKANEGQLTFDEVMGEPESMTSVCIIDGLLQALELALANQYVAPYA